MGRFPLDRAGRIVPLLQAEAGASERRPISLPANCLHLSKNRKMKNLTRAVKSRRAFLFLESRLPGGPTMKLMQGLVRKHPVAIIVPACERRQILDKYRQTRISRHSLGKVAHHD